MSKKLWTELICDTCGNCEHELGNITKPNLYLYGWTADKNKVFCNEKCKAEYYADVRVWIQ